MQCIAFRPLAIPLELLFSGVPLYLGANDLTCIQINNQRNPAHETPLFSGIGFAFHPGSPFLTRLKENERLPGSLLPGLPLGESGRGTRARLRVEGEGRGIARPARRRSRRKVGETLYSR